MAKDKILSRATCCSRPVPWVAGLGFQDSAGLRALLDRAEFQVGLVFPVLRGQDLRVLLVLPGIAELQEQAELLVILGPLDSAVRSPGLLVFPGIQGRAGLLASLVLQGLPGSGLLASAEIQEQLVLLALLELLGTLDILVILLRVPAQPGRAEPLVRADIRGLPALAA